MNIKTLMRMSSYFLSTLPKNAIFQQKCRLKSKCKCKQPSKYIDIQPFILDFA